MWNIHDKEDILKNGRRIVNVTNQAPTDKVKSTDDVPSSLKAVVEKPEPAANPALRSNSLPLHRTRVGITLPGGIKLNLGHKHRDISNSGSIGRIKEARLNTLKHSARKRMHVLQSVCFATPFL